MNHVKIQSQIAENQLKRNKFECMICCDIVKRHNPIWYCNSCYNIFHLRCAIEWCNKSINSRNEAIAQAQYPSLGQSNSSTQLAAGQSEFSHHAGPSAAGSSGYGRYSARRQESIEWPCPTCRTILSTKPDKYKCFCSKVIRPDQNRHLTPHSCGQLCGRKRPDADCPHSCNSICHPGRCVPCGLTSRKSCFCGKLSQEVKCSASISSCGDTCNKPLSCGLHLCPRECHEGQCGPCAQVITISCKCDQERVDKKCSEVEKTVINGERVVENFSCDKVCGKRLDCGNHFCTEKCHPGPQCKSCELTSDNIKTCPCGSKVLDRATLESRKSCLDKIPTCENKCNKALICGPEKNKHRCKKKCHPGFCPPCKLKTQAFCRCKQNKTTIDCARMFKRIEEGDKVIFEHVEFKYTCEARCNKLKTCGRHRCNNKCCEFIDVVGAAAHRCEQPCNRKLPCGQHNCPETCHPGQCGDCTNIGWEELTCHCGAMIMYPPIPCGARAPACQRPCRRAHNCGHPVRHECHDNSEKCAPCTIFVKKSCFCGADSKDSVYCYLPGYSCGRTCNKQLACQTHTCKRICHDNECETPAKDGTIKCSQTCKSPRYSCKHPCALPCHGKTPCQSSSCKKSIEIKCKCGNKVERTECHKISRDSDNRNLVAMLSTNRFNQDSVVVDLSKKPPNPGSDTDDDLKRLDCDESCLILQRNKALAEALDIAKPDVKPTSIFGEDPLRLLREATAQDYKFVAATYNSLVKFVTTAKESDKRFIFMQFPPTGKLRREVIHELAHHFHCTSESRNEEPFKHVVVRAYRNKSCIPDFNIEQLLTVID